MMQSFFIQSIPWKSTLAFLGLCGAVAICAAQPKPGPMPWKDASLSPDRRADLALAQMTQDEKLQLVHGIGWGVLRAGAPVPPEENGGAGFVPGIQRLGIPDINMADSAVGIRMAALHGRYATLLPSTVGAAASYAAAHTATFTVRNTGGRAGDEIAEVYVELPPAAGEKFKRLAGWQRVPLAAGESRGVTVTLDPLTLSVFDTAKDRFEMPKGVDRVLVGSSSRATPLTATMAE